MSKPVFEIYNEDCITGMAERLQENSVDLVLCSPPFSDLFIYSGKLDDMGNCADGIDSRQSEFGLSFRFFSEQLLRILKPGHNACIHIQQLVAYENKHGFIGRRDFRGAVIDMFMAGGWTFFGEFVIPKNPQIVAKRSNLHSLMFATGKRNSRDLAPACNDFVLIIKKPGECIDPIRGLYDRDENPGGWFTSDEWIKWARGVWDDIRETDVLEGWRHAREEGDEKHVCPLQLSVIRRCVKLYSAPGETVIDPFMGIGSTAVVALQEGRNAIGFEIKETWHRQAVRNCEAVNSGVGMQAFLFDLMESEESPTESDDSPSDSAVLPDPSDTQPGDTNR